MKKKNPQMGINAGVGAGENAAAPALRETMEINICGTVVTVYKDELAKEIYKSLRELFMLNPGA